MNVMNQTDDIFDVLHRLYLNIYVCTEIQTRVFIDVFVCCNVQIDEQRIDLILLEFESAPYQR